MPSTLTARSQKVLLMENALHSCNHIVRRLHRNNAWNCCKHFFFHLAQKQKLCTTHSFRPSMTAAMECYRFYFECYLVGWTGQARPTWRFFKSVSLVALSWQVDKNTVECWDILTLWELDCNLFCYLVTPGHMLVTQNCEIWFQTTKVVKMSGNVKCVGILTLRELDCNLFCYLVTPGHMLVTRNFENWF